MSSLRRDLFERRLWPLVVVLIAAIVAVPFLLAGHQHKSAATLADSASPVPAAKTTTSTTTSTRSAGSDPTSSRRSGAGQDPFAVATSTTGASATGKTGTAATAGSSTSTAASGSAAATSSGSAGTSSGTGSSTTATTSTSGSAGATTTTTTTTTKTKSTVTGTWTVYGLDIRYRTAAGKWQSIQNLARFTPLPAASWPKLMFIGVANNGRNGVFALGAGVTAKGKALCRPSHDRCTLISLPVGGVERVIWVVGADRQRTLQLKVTRATKQIVHQKATLAVAVDRHSQIGLCELELGDPVAYHVSSTGQLQGTSNPEPACTKKIRKVAVAFPGTSSQSGAVTQSGAVSVPSVIAGS